VRRWYLTPERNAPWVWSRPKVRKLCFAPNGPPDSGRRYSDSCQ
jgi:hypothetical protein